MTIIDLKENKKENEFLNKLNEIIKNSKDHSKTFNDYIDDFKNFYRNYNLYMYCLNDNRVINILEFFIKNEKEQIFIYAQRNLLEEFQNKMLLYFQQFHFKDLEINYEKINELMIMKHNYERIYKVINDKDYIDNLSDNFNKDGINCVNYKEFCREYKTAYILILKNNALKLPIEVVKKLASEIKNSSIDDYLYEIIKSNNSLNLMDKEFFYQYVENFIELNEIITDEKIGSDSLINEVLNESTNFELFLYLFKKMPIDIFFEYFENINQFVNSIDRYDISKGNKEETIYKFFLKLYDSGDYFELLYDYYLNNKDLDIVKIFFDDEKIKKIKKMVSMSQIEYLSDEIIINILDNSDEYTKYFISNLIDYNKNNGILNEKILEKLKKYSNLIHYINKYKTITYEESQKNIFDILEGKEIDDFDLVLHIKNIINKINNNEVTAYVSILQENVNGAYGNKYNYITIDLNNILKLKEFYKTKDIKNLGVIATVFHESQHYNQFKKMSEDEQRFFLSDMIIDKYFPKFYETNYVNIEYEVDARMVSYDKIMEFFSQNKELNLAVSLHYLDLQNILLLKRQRKRIVKGSDDAEKISDIFKFLLELKPNIEEKEKINNLLNKSNTTK